jgi:hypothetical protein
MRRSSSCSDEAVHGLYCHVTHSGADGLRWYCLLVNIAEAKDHASQNRETPMEYSAEELRVMLFEVRERGA